MLLRAIKVTIVTVLIEKNYPFILLTGLWQAETSLYSFLTCILSYIDLCTFPVNGIHISLYLGPKPLTYTYFIIKLILVFEISDHIVNAIP